MKIFEKIVKEVLKPFTKEGINYCIIGGLAVISYGVRRGTSDFDIVISEENIEKALKIIYEKGYKLITNIDEKKKKLYYCKTLNQALAYVRLLLPKVIKVNKGGLNGMFGDIWINIGIPYKKLEMDAQKFNLYGERVRIASVKDLIKLKKYSGRTVDKLDVYELRKIEKGEEGAG